MTLDPAFGLLLSVPLLIAALAAVAVARPTRRAAAVMSACGVLAFVAGCGNQKEGARTAPPAAEQSSSAAVATAAPAQALPQRAFTAADTPRRGARKRAGWCRSTCSTRTRPARIRPLTVAPRDTVHVIGWAYHEAHNTPCADVGLLVDGKRAFPALYGYARPDVAAFYKDRARTNSGIRSTVPAARWATARMLRR